MTGNCLWVALSCERLERNHADLVSLKQVYENNEADRWEK
jgi:hypothetical protein